ncbi:conserved hypothetical protein [Ricinus communis]|uniref:Uncharacterized protein n=1 Tax=Ricinus communis TaxID=3988 RepID=B9T9F4_RICCO|nr:conserved hypothetical protein [Ricinus communis]
MGCQQRDEQAGGDGSAETGFQPRQQHDEVERDQQEDAELGGPPPRRRHEEMLLQDAGQPVCHHLDRGHGRRYRRRIEIADAGRGLADQHDLVAILVERNLAAHDVEEGIDRESRLPALAAVVEAVHAQTGVGGDVEPAQRHRFAQLHADIVHAQIEALRRDQQRQRRIELVEVRHHQRLYPQAAVAVDRRIEVTNRRRHLAQRLDHAGRDVQRQRRQRLGAGHVLQRHRAHEIRQRSVRPTLGFAILEQHGQRHVAGLADAGCQQPVGVQRVFRLVQHRGECLQRFARRGRLRLTVDRCSAGLAFDRQQLVDVGQPRIDLRFGEENGGADHLGLCLRQPVDHARMHIARPRPATDVVDALLVDRNDGDA